MSASTDGNCELPIFGGETVSCRTTLLWNQRGEARENSSTTRFINESYLFIGLASPVDPSQRIYGMRIKSAGRQIGLRLRRWCNLVRFVNDCRNNKETEEEQPGHDPANSGLLADCNKTAMGLN